MPILNLISYLCLECFCFNAIAAARACCWSGRGFNVLRFNETEYQSSTVVVDLLVHVFIRLRVRDDAVGLRVHLVKFPQLGQHLVQMMTPALSRLVSLYYCIAAIAKHILTCSVPFRHRLRTVYIVDLFSVFLTFPETPLLVDALDALL